jgi:hypothetical protein
MEQYLTGTGRFSTGWTKSASEWRNLFERRNNLVADLFELLYDLALATSRGAQVVYFETRRLSDASGRVQVYSNA